MSEELFLKKEYFAMSLDPIHIGTGGYRLGRVDLSIIRDPVTNIPKIPATSLIGSARTFTAMKTKKFPQCAGKGKEEGITHCGVNSPACPVCVPYGFSNKNYSLEGLAQFYDAHILLFPIATMIGPVWITCPLAFDFTNEINFVINEEGFIARSGIKNEQLNFGYLLLKKIVENKTGCENKDSNFNKLEKLTIWNNIPREIQDKTIILSNKLFSKVVNANLEVRTSVSINPETGAAEEGALFTYEAIPRGTILRFEVVYNDPTNYKINGSNIKIDGDINANKEWIREQVEKGLELFEILGIGGMNSRGMGRIRVLNLGENNPISKKEGE